MIQGNGLIRLSPEIFRHRPRGGRSGMSLLLDRGFEILEKRISHEPYRLYPPLISILPVALLYSSVGHGGGSGYIAVLALFSLAPASFKPTALVLNILVSSIATFSFARAGHFSLAAVLAFCSGLDPMQLYWRLPRFARSPV